MEQVTGPSLKAKTFFYLSTFAFCWAVLVHAHPMDALSWGKAETESVYQGEVWNDVYMDLDSVRVEASVPNYAGGILMNGMISVNGAIGESIGYTISTSFNGDFAVPKSEKKFIEIIKEANPDFTVTPIPAKDLGAIYAVDLTPKKKSIDVCWRFFCVKNRIIQAGTDDKNDDRRLHFFESIQIQT